MSIPNIGKTSLEVIRRHSVVSRYGQLRMSSDHYEELFSYISANSGNSFSVTSQSPNHAIKKSRASHQRWCEQRYLTMKSQSTRRCLSLKHQIASITLRRFESL